MSIFDDNAIIANATCRQGHPVPITLGQARHSQTVRCPTCNQAINIHGEEFRKGLEKVETDARAFGENIGKLFK